MIRVLILLPGQETDDIRCKLEHTYISPRQQDPQPEGSRPYEALSYTWGDPKRTQTILLGGSLFEVTVNLEIALRHLRLTDSPRVLWVDALCIDQKNIPERNKQVLRMNLIYEQASRVIVWLGEESIDSNKAIDLIEELGGKPEDMDWVDRSTRYHDLSYILRPKDPSMLMAFTDLDDSDIEVLHNLLRRRAWWSRMWVIQEIIHSSKATLVCGNRAVDWVTMDSLLSRPDVAKLNATSLSRMIGALRKAYYLNQLREDICQSRDLRMTPTGIRLRSLLERYEDWQCGDPRDKVYAVLGLYGCQKSDNLQVDYGNPVSKVYTQATQDVIYDICVDPQHGQQPSLDVICAAYRDEMRQPGLPSWVPDWSTKRRFAWCQFRYRQNIPFSAGGKGRLESLPPISASGILTIEGILWNQLFEVSDGISCFKKNISRMELGQAFQLWEPSGLESMTYPTKEDILDVYWQTLLGGLDQFEGKRLDPENFATYKEQFLLWSGRKQSDHSLSMSGAATSSADSPFEDLAARVFGFTIATTAGGYLALVPVLSEPGDRVCVVPTLNVPLVLRKLATSPPSENTFTLVGPCYVHGIMDGEVMEKIEAGEVKKQGIDIA
ncbi:Heterokaryon incompatibility protein (HET) domain containing protein [Elaphomyces granulatus]